MAQQAPTPHASMVEETLFQLLCENPNLIVKWIVSKNRTYGVFYINTIVDQHLLQRDLLGRIATLEDRPSADEMAEHFPVGAVKEAEGLEAVAEQLLAGWVYLDAGPEAPGLLFYLYKPQQRNLSRPDIESQVLGPQLAFTETLTTNIGLLQGYVADPQLCQELHQVGVRTRTQVALFYMNEVTDDALVDRLRKRLGNLQIDGIIDSAVLAQLLDDHPYSIFPQMLLTERVDRVAFSLLEGKLVLLVAGSPFAIVCPVVFMDFFSSSEDHLVRWNMATFTRILRLAAMILSLGFTPMYVAALTFHYEIIPSAMVVPLAESRTRVPFPPLMEALFLEFTMELLREAGARLPTKVGQTIGIVGGIVIGQAAVQAGFTSNILIIIVALGALSSFTTPVYLMGITIRIVRFPLILLAGLLGGLGLVVGMSFIAIHLLRLSSLEQPYLYPVYPLRPANFKASVIRMPFAFLRRRTTFIRSEDQYRWQKKPPERKKDIDE
ncbi:spore germination protein [Paenibacillus chartarius]|uniref:Spore germination protein n=1 Tax=Paenibacillus chartarius TaxID=747481 RepID=A0ABV6DH68_9BACL